MKTINYNKWLYNSDPDDMPRKIKKALYGTKVSKSKLRKEINEKSLAFCPQCRHKLFQISTGNMVDYPEIWEYNSCNYCGLVIGGADNSVGTDIMRVAQELVIGSEESQEEISFKTLYDAIKYVGNDMPDYI